MGAGRSNSLGSAEDIRARLIATIIVSIVIMAARLEGLPFSRRAALYALSAIYQFGRPTNRGAGHELS